MSSALARRGYGSPGPSVSSLALVNSDDTIATQLLEEGATDTFNQTDLHGPAVLTNPIRRAALGGEVQTSEAYYRDASAQVVGDRWVQRSADRTLRWDYQHNHVAFSTDEAAAVVGTFDGPPIDAGRLGQVSIDNTEYGVITAVTLDDLPFEESTEILVTTVSQVSNVGADAARITVGDLSCFETPQVTGYFEVVIPQGSLTLDLGGYGASAVAVDALQRTAPATLSDVGGGKWQLDFNDAAYTFGDEGGELDASPWFIITVDRG